jgi:hypoxanthine-guanine phosphoribosyltransferase
MLDDLQKVLIPADVIAARVREMAQQIAGQYNGDDAHRLTLLPVLAGSMIFTADLIREMPCG